MENFPYIEVTFVIEGKNFDPEQFTEEIGILPSEVRGMDGWPESIQNNSDIPEELQPRCEWCINQKEESCRKIELLIGKIISQLAGKEQKIKMYCEKRDLKRGLIVTIHAEAMNLPEMVLSPQIVSFLGNIGAEIGFNIYVY